MNKKGNFWLIIFFGIFLLTGIGLMASGIVTMTSSRSFRERAVEITAVITDIHSYRSHDEQRHSVYVEYTYGGRTYEDVELSFYSSGMYEGEEITILCDPDNPGHIKAANGLTFVYILLIGMGLLFAVIGAVPIIIMAARSSRQKKIRRSGRKLYATVEDIVLNTGYTVNGQHPYQIYCTYRDEYKDIIYRFKSGNIWTNPSLMLHPGDTIPIFVDEKNYRHYYVDSESILENKIVDYT